jgi:hypothetical protein
MSVPYGLLHRRWQKLEQQLQSPTITAVILIGQDEPDPPHASGVKVIQLTLGTPFEQAEEAR